MTEYTLEASVVPCNKAEECSSILLAASVGLCRSLLAEGIAEVGPYGSSLAEGLAECHYTGS
jgi:hypothetical protein